jgi:hypothetical protein
MALQFANSRNAIVCRAVTVRLLDQTWLHSHILPLFYANQLGVIFDNEKKFERLRIVYLRGRPAKLYGMRGFEVLKSNFCYECSQTSCDFV